MVWCVRYEWVRRCNIGRPRLSRPGLPIRELVLKNINIGYRYIYSAEGGVTTNQDLSLTKTTHRKQITQFTIDSICLASSRTFTKENPETEKKAKRKVQPILVVRLSIHRRSTSCGLLSQLTVDRPGSFPPCWFWWLKKRNERAGEKRLPYIDSPSPLSAKHQPTILVTKMIYEAPSEYKLQPSSPLTTG